MKFCYNIVKEGLLVDLSNTTINSERVISLIPGIYEPFVYYDDFRLCGVFAKLITQLSAIYAYGIAIRKPQANESVTKLLNSNYGDIHLYPTRQITGELTRTEVRLEMSEAIGIKYGDHIYTYVKSYKWPTFAYFCSFQPIVWLSLLLSIVVIACIVTTITENFNGFKKFVRRFVEVLLSEPFPRNTFRKTVKSLPQTILLTVWLLSCTVLLSSFSGVLLQFFMKTIVNDAIDSFEQLYERKDLSIIANTGQYFENYVTKFKDSNEMAREFGRRTQFINFLSQLDKPANKVTKRLTESLKSGKYVLVVGKTRLNSVLFAGRTKSISKLSRHLYVSMYGLENTFFSVYMSLKNAELVRNLNKLIMHLHDSGIYDFWLSGASSSLSRDRQWKFPERFKILFVHKLKGVFYLWIVGIGMSIVTFISQCYVRGIIHSSF